MDLSEPRTQVLSRLNEEKFIRKFADGHTEALEVGQYNKFRGVTIKNSIRTGKTIEVRVNDRGPFNKKFSLDLSQVAAKALGIYKLGYAKVEIAYVLPKK